MSVISEEYSINVSASVAFIKKFFFSRIIPNISNTKEEKEEQKEAAAAAFSQIFYKCLEGLDLSDREKRSLMDFEESRVVHAVEFVKRKQEVDSVMGMLKWVCQQPILPELPRERRKNQTPQQKLASEYNQFLRSNGYTVQAKQNEEMIPNDRMVIIEMGRPISITLNHPLPILQEDFRKSRDEILKTQKNNARPAR